MTTAQVWEREARLQIREVEHLKDINADLLAALEGAKRGFDTIAAWSKKDARHVAEACSKDIDNIIAKATP